MKFLQRVKISGESMLPTLRPGQSALFIKATPKHEASKFGRRNKWLGKIVLIARINQFGAKDFYQVKRITEIKDGKFFVVGDNESKSTDSRSFGYLTSDEIIGRKLL